MCCCSGGMKLSLLRPGTLGDGARRRHLRIFMPMPARDCHCPQNKRKRCVQSQVNEMMHGIEWRGSGRARTVSISLNRGVQPLAGRGKTPQLPIPVSQLCAWRASPNAAAASHLHVCLRVRASAPTYVSKTTTPPRCNSAWRCQPSTGTVGRSTFTQRGAQQPRILRSFPARG